MSRWITVTLAVLATFALVTGVLGAWVLPLVLTSEADRWVVAAGAGTAISAVAVLWGERRLAGKAVERGPEPGAAPVSAIPAPASSISAPEDRHVDVKGNVSGVIVTGDQARIKKRR